MVHAKVRLKGGRFVVIRDFQIVDKEKLVEMYASLSSEAVRWGMPPYTRDVIDRWIGNLQNLTILIAVCDDKIVGHAQLFKLPHPRRKGTCNLVIYLHQDFHNQGLGTTMLTELLHLARSERLHRINLQVIADNEQAVHLYEKFGFTIEGRMKDSYLGEDGKYHDELAMGLILPSSTSPNRAP
jgi:RimJ/RimL family protein N-acetyltransferase